MKFLLLILPLLLFSKTINVVPIATKSINWKEQITLANVKLIQSNSKYKCKEYLDIKRLKKNKYRAKHYILKDFVICADDVYVAVSKKIKFNFGFFEIERDGEIIKETDKYIKIRNLDGKIEKIYKDGRGE